MTVRAEPATQGQTSTTDDQAQAPAQTSVQTSGRWRDGKRYLWLLGIAAPLLPFAAWGLVELTGLDLFWYFPLMFFFGLIPLADLVIGTDRNNPPDEALEDLQEDRYYRWITYAFIPVQYAALIWGAWMLSQDRLHV